MSNPVRSILLLAILIIFLSTCKESARSSKESVDHLIPSWSMESVWYEILPERFRNGDSANDPTYGDILGAPPYEQLLPWQVHPWTSDWYELQPYEAENGKDLWFNITRRRYGGDIQGIISQLDYLQQLGVGVLQLTPVFMSPSAFKLDASCLHHIDPTFGPDPESDKRIISEEIPDDRTTWKLTAADSLMLVLINEAHERKMKIVLEVSFNHLGTSSFAFQDVLASQQNSRFEDWFFIRSFQDETRGTLLEYKGWRGMQEYPELRKTRQGPDPGVKQYLFDITRRWMDPLGNNEPANGIDGWILLEADGHDPAFWNEWSALVRSVNPRAYIGAEVSPQSYDNVLQFIQQAGFSAWIHDPFMFIASQYFFKGKYIFNTHKLDSALSEYRNRLPPGINPASQIQLGSATTDRIASRSVNRRVFNFLDQEQFLSRAIATNTRYKSDKPKKDDLTIVKLMAIFQMTSPGIPVVYYGDEVAMWGSGSPCNGKPMLWSDLDYDDEKFYPNSMKRRIPDNVVPSNDMMEHYKRLVRIRNSFKSMQFGDFKTVLLDSDNEIYGFSRAYDRETVYIILNNSAEYQQVVVPVQENGIYINALDENREVLAEEQKIRMRIRGKWAAILTLRPTR